MTMRGMVGIGLLLGVLGSPRADAAWGLKFEISFDGIIWSSSFFANPFDTVKFRVGAYFDVGTKITTSDGTGNAMAVSRFTGSNQITHFNPSRDVFNNVVRTAPVGTSEFAQLSGGVFGTSTDNSYAGQTLSALPAQPQTYLELLRGEIKFVSILSYDTLVLKSKTFGTALTKGLTFYHDGSRTNMQTGMPDAPRMDYEAAILYEPAPPSLALLLVACAVARRRRSACSTASPGA